jgi:hypothetical protein
MRSAVLAMSDCTCVRGDDGQVKVPRSRCPQHGWVDTPTPAPALTDEQIDAPSINEIRADYVRTHTRNFDAYAVGRSLTSEQEVYGERFDRTVAAVVARAKREERERIADELEAWAETHRPTSPYTEGRRDAAYRAVDVALRGATR